MFDTPQARDSFQLDWSHRATATLARMAQASSTTTTTPAVSSSPATAACSQAAAHVMITPRAAEW